MGMRFQSRDDLILRFIYFCGGVVAVRHLWRIFWPGKSLRAVQRRMRKLCEAGFLTRPAGRQYRTHPIPEAVVWLGWRGILHIAGQHGVDVAPPSNPGVDDQLKTFARDLSKQGIRWVWRPSWSKLRHDLKIIDFRIAVEEALRELPALMLDSWINETTFRADVDEVTYQVKDKHGNRKQEKRGVIPDAYFAISDLKRKARGKLFRARHLLEVDMASHSNPSFGRDKVLAYHAYIRSPEYYRRFGSNTGRWLIVSTGRRRMENLMHQTKRMLGKDTDAFYFTTYRDVDNGNVLVEPIWWRVGESESRPLFSSRMAGSVVVAGSPRTGTVQAHHP